MVYHGLWVCHHWPGVEWRPGGYCAGMDLDAATLRALDWPAVLTALARHARTTLGAARAQTLELVNTPDAARRHYRAVAEVLHLEAEAGGRIPVGAVTDIREPLTRAVRGTVLEAEDLRAVGHALDAMDQLKRWLEDRGENAPELDALAAPIRIDASLRDDLQESFDATGRISGDRYPDLADLRARTGALKDRIQQVLDELVRGDSLGGALQDRYVTERGGRFVIPVRAGQNRRGLGIVHATSQSGETVFVEPAEVVERTNQLKEVEGAVTRVERRILGRLSTQVAAQAPAVLAALAAATEIDLACARAGLGGALDGVIPEVQGSGVLRLSAARHPVLALRGVDVVANDLAVGGGAVGLVLSGPNTGGKTIAMKTLGLAALFVRAGVPFPAAEGSRVDVFVDVLADVGDLQSVEGDLSTFSGHVSVLRAMLERAGKDTLVLLDEIGVGTDPAQGAALARAVLEALVERGARVCVTTHYAELKGMSASDSRFSVAAVQYRDGRPTYRVQAGLAGESHGIETARRLALPGSVVERARALLDSGTRNLADLMLELESARAELQARTDSLAAARAAVADREASLTHKLTRLEARRKALRAEMTAGFEQRLRAQEDELKGIVAALQRNPDPRRAGATLARLRETRAAVRAQWALPEEGLAPPESVAVGDSVFVRSLGKEGQVLALRGRGRVTVRVGGLEMQLKLGDLAPGHGRTQKETGSPPGGRGRTVPGPKTSRASRAGRMETGQEVRAVRLDHNTVDLRGQRVDAALELVEQHIDALAVRGESFGFVLHGHGTGALKTAVRRWLPQARGVRRWRPANADEGGDAFTVLELA